MTLVPLIFARSCVECPSDPPECKACPSGQVCTLSVQTCQRCPEARCVKNSDQPSNHAGAIAGGVVGGLVGLGFVIGALLWYKYRHRRMRHLQKLRQQVSEMTPPDSPSYAEDIPELKAPSIVTHGDSQMVPIEIHFSQSPFGNPYHLDNPTIRESIRESEYSFGSQNIEDNSGGLRNYDVAVQGRANLVDLNKSRQRRPQPPPSRLAQGQLYDIVEHNESTILAGRSQFSRPQSTRPASTIATEQTRSNHGGDLQDPRRFTAQAPTQEGTSRYSRASSREYVADLPEEAQIYNNHGFFQG